MDVHNGRGWGGGWGVGGGGGEWKASTTDSLRSV